MGAHREGARGNGCGEVLGGDGGAEGVKGGSGGVYGGSDDGEGGRAARSGRGWLRGRRGCAAPVVAPVTATEAGAARERLGRHEKNGELGKGGTPVQGKSNLVVALFPNKRYSYF